MQQVCAPCTNLVDDEARAEVSHVRDKGVGSLTRKRNPIPRPSNSALVALGHSSCFTFGQIFPNSLVQIVAASEVQQPADFSFPHGDPRYISRSSDGGREEFFSQTAMASLVRT